MVCDRARIQGAGRRQRLTDIRHRRPSEVRGRLQRLHYVPPVSPSPACRARRARRFGRRSADADRSTDSKSHGDHGMVQGWKERKTNNERIMRRREEGEEWLARKGQTAERERVG